MAGKVRSGQREEKGPGVVRPRREDQRWSNMAERQLKGRRRGQTCQRQLEMGQLARTMGVGRGHWREERQPETSGRIRERQWAGEAVGKDQRWLQTGSWWGGVEGKRNGKMVRERGEADEGCQRGEKQLERSVVAKDVKAGQRESQVKRAAES